MKLNNKGFALTSMIYMLIVLFLMIMLLVLSNLAQRKVILDKITYDIKNKLDQGVSINAAELPYQNERTGIYYETLELAINKAESEDTIKVLKNVTDQSLPTIEQAKNIKIDIAGKEVTLSQSILNSGVLDIYTSEPGGIIYSTAQKTFENNNSNSILTINDTDSTNKLSILNIASIEGTRIVVNRGVLILNNAEIEIKNTPTSSTTDTYIVTNYGRVEVNNSTLTNTVRNNTYDVGIINVSGYPNARIAFNSGTLKTSGTAIYNNGGTSASYDDPVIRITGGTIASSKAYAIRENITNSYDVISGGELYNENTTGYPTVNMNGKLKMTGGTIYAYNGSSLNVNSTGSADITGGHIVKDKNPITNSWVGGATINTAGTSNLTVAGNAVIESKSGNSSNVIYHASTGTTTISENALIENKGAVTAMTIKSSGKILVTGGKVKSNGGQAIVNTCDSSTSSAYGKIEITGGTVETTGELAVNTNSAYGTITIGTQGATDNTYPKITGTVRGSLNTAGDIIINSGTITATTKEAVHTKKTLIVNGGIITGISSYAITSNDANSKITVNGGTITTSGTYAITTTNAMGGEIEINGGTITKTAGNYAAVNNYIGTTTIKGGTITSATTAGVYATSGTITIGTNDATAPSTSNPSITGKTYGVQATTGTINFYDGKIIGQGGTGSAISGTVTKPTGYNIQKDLSSSTETAYLKGTYVVNIDPNGGTYNGTTSTTGYAANSGSTINVGNPTRSGYTFGGWLPTKQDYGATWVEVFYHNNQQGTVLFSSANSWSEAKSVDDVDKYSILGQLEKFRTNTSQPFEFLLEYDEITGKYNRWQQTANPVTTSVADGAATTSVGYSTNFTGSHIDWTGCSWGGLTRSSRSSVFIDGAVANNGWWYAIAPTTAYNGGIPGPNSTVVKQGVHLWVKANDNLSNISQQVTGVVNNGTYTVKHNITLKAIWIPN